MSDFIKTDIQPPKVDELEKWVAEQLKNYGPTLLAFADDGVIWGRLLDGKLVTAPDAPALREKTPQQALIFGAGCEVRLFREELGGWKALRVVDAGEVIVESQILWGDKSTAQPQNGFLRVSEYRSGIPDQFLPVDQSLGEGECARLEVHHLVEYDNETGEARIALSRLAGLSIGKRDVEVEK